MMCTWLSDSEFERYSTVKDADINEVLQEVRKIKPIWFVDEQTHIIERFLRKPVNETHYTVYQIYKVNGISSYPEVRVQMSVSTKRDLLNFLYGLNVGYHHE